MRKKDLVNYVKNKKTPNQRIGLLDIVFKDRFLNDVDHKAVFEKINQLLPDHILNLIDIVYIGDFSEFKEREIDAVYSDGAIYVSNNNGDENDLIKDVIHEFAHAAEDNFGEIIYADGTIEQNFLLKRKKIDSFINYEKDTFDRTEHDEGLDSFLKDEVGYEKLNNITKGIFLGAYSVTSLREYFARGFEEYYLGERSYLKEICPYIYIKISLVEDIDNGENDYEF